MLMPGEGNTLASRWPSAAQLQLLLEVDKSLALTEVALLHVDRLLIDDLSFSQGDPSSGWSSVE